MTRKQKHQQSGEIDAGSRGERLQKVLAAAGLGSRRQCEEFITAGRVEIDRQVVTELGTRVDPTRQEIRVDGESIRKPQRLYFAVNKPVGVVTTNFDPSGRSRVIDLVPTEERVFAVGRLDRSSEGLILVTNDGEFANRLTHPRYGVEKTYLVRIAGSPEPQQLERLKKGVHLAEGYARAQSITVKKQHGQSTDLVIVLNEGRNREIRRILARVGHKVLALKRVAVGSVKLGDLPVGGWRRLMPPEIDGLLNLAKEKRRAARGAGVSPAKKPTRRASEDKQVSIGTTARPPKDEESYIQKQALLAQPLSLDDLLRDDMDEGPLPISGTADIAIDDDAETSVNRGGVIDYEDEFSPPPQTPRPKSPGQRPLGSGGQRPSGGGNQHRPKSHEHRGKRTGQRPFGKKREELEREPRESFGKKRGGKRLFGKKEAGRGPAGEKAGNLRFRPKPKKNKAEAQGTDNQRRGVRRGEQRGSKPEKQFGKHGGKRKGRR